jgi:hypothetical protein
MGYFCHFLKTAQSKQSPNRRKIAQSGHPGHEANSNFATHKFLTLVAEIRSRGLSKQ